MLSGHIFPVSVHLHNHDSKPIRLFSFEHAIIVTEGAKL